MSHSLEDTGLQNPAETFLNKRIQPPVTKRTCIHSSVPLRGKHPHRTHTVQRASIRMTVAPVFPAQLSGKARCFW